MFDESPTPEKTKFSDLTMSRIMGGRVLPNFLPTSPTNEIEPTWEELIETGIQIQQRMDESLQRAMDFCSSYLSKKHGVSRSKAAKDLHDGFVKEYDEPEDSDPIRDECQEKYPDGKDIAI